MPVEIAEQGAKISGNIIYRDISCLNTEEECFALKWL